MLCSVVWFLSPARSPSSLKHPGAESSLRQAAQLSNQPLPHTSPRTSLPARTESEDAKHNRNRGEKRTQTTLPSSHPLPSAALTWTWERQFQNPLPPPHHTQGQERHQGLSTQDGAKRTWSKARGRCSNHLSGPSHGPEHSC